MHTYLGQPVREVVQRIRWNPDDPNLLQMNLPGGIQVRWVLRARAGSRRCSPSAAKRRKTE